MELPLTIDQLKACLLGFVVFLVMETIRATRTEKKTRREPCASLASDSTSQPRRYAEQLDIQEFNHLSREVIDSEVSKTGG